MIEDPVSLDERAQVASQCVADLNLPMPALVDKLDDKVNQAYGGWPDRLYLIDKSGRIAYAGGRGPFLFEPDAWAQAIEREVGAAANGKK